MVRRREGVHAAHETGQRSRASSWAGSSAGFHRPLGRVLRQGSAILGSRASAQHRIGLPGRGENRHVRRLVFLEHHENRAAGEDWPKEGSRSLFACGAGSQRMQTEGWNTQPWRHRGGHVPEFPGWRLIEEGWRERVHGKGRWYQGVVGGVSPHADRWVERNGPQ